MSIRLNLTWATISILSLAGTASAENWPSWRGPTGDGICTEKGVPTTWSKTKNVAWRLELPGPAGATPVIWDDRIFLSSVDGNDLVLMCISTKGKELWRRSLDGSETIFPDFASIDGYRFTDQDLESLASNNKIEVLDITESRVTDAGLEVLKTLANLKWLYVTSIPRISDKGLQSIVECPSISELCILDTGVTDNGLQHLIALSKLECLRVGSYEMDGSGLLHLKSLPELRYLELDIDFNERSKQFADELQSAKPELRICW